MAVKHDENSPPSTTSPIRDSARRSFSRLRKLGPTKTKLTRKFDALKEKHQNLNLPRRSKSHKLAKGKENEGSETDAKPKRPSQSRLSFSKFRSVDEDSAPPCPPNLSLTIPELPRRDASPPRLVLPSYIERHAGPATAAAWKLAETRRQERATEERETEQLIDEMRKETTSPCVATPMAPKTCTVSPIIPQTIKFQDTLPSQSYPPGRTLWQCPRPFRAAGVDVSPTDEARRAAAYNERITADSWLMHMDNPYPRFASVPSSTDQYMRNVHTAEAAERMDRRVTNSGSGSEDVARALRLASKGVGGYVYVEYAQSDAVTSSEEDDEEVGDVGRSVRRRSSLRSLFSKGKKAILRVKQRSGTA